MPITDEDAAIQAISTLETLSSEQNQALESIGLILHNDEPFVDIHKLFGLYDVLYFRGLLVPRVEVLWSPRLTLCAGMCELSKDTTTGKLTRIRLKMSTSLLQYRPRSDTINTLLHEAIHAYFFVTTSWRHSRGDDGTGHGAGFQLLADAINCHGKYKVTIYHTFHDEVDSYRTHVWQCNGPCRKQTPFFGLVKRSMNRAPGKGDLWWTKHETECGGTYTKIAEPELTKKQKSALSKKERAGRQKNKLDSWIKVVEKDVGEESQATGHPIEVKREYEASSSASSSKRKAELISLDDVVSNMSPKWPRRNSGEAQKDGVLIVQKMLVNCPICNVRIAEEQINEHLDVVHP